MTAVKQVQVTFDCADPRALSLFWNEVLGYELPPPPPVFDSWDAFSASLPPELRNSASASEDPAGVDVRAAPGLQGEERMTTLEAECERLVALGATRVERFEPAPPMDAGHIVMRDPEGNEFCLD
ncbi:MAG: VOC family protein [Nocardioides sp.]|nr:VOC family protein [Nocardioides sp.]